MEVPHVDAVGVTHMPPGYHTRARTRPWPIRLAAMTLLAAFLGVSTVTTVASLGRWCLTSNAGASGPDVR